MNPPLRPDISDPKANLHSGAHPDPGAKAESNHIDVKPDPNLLLHEEGITTAEPAALRVANALPPKKITVTNLTKESILADQGKKITGVYPAPKAGVPNPAHGSVTKLNSPQGIAPAKKTTSDFSTLPSNAAPAITGIAIKAKSEVQKSAPPKSASQKIASRTTPAPLTAREGGGEVFAGDIEQLQLASHGRLPWSVGASRLMSLDLFRGITIAAMLLVNDPGSWSHVYPPLEHAEWNGWTHTDLIFPFFLFIVGVSMAFSFSARMARGDGRGRLALHTLRRAVIIYAIGFFLAMFPYFDLQHLRHIRIMGVLARIALCYGVAGMIYLATERVGRALAIIAALAGYWAMMTRVWVPGYGAGNLSPDGNLAAYIDRALMLGHLWKPTWDPEGLLSSIPAVATVLIGSFVGELMMPNRTVSEALGIARQTTWQHKVKWLVASGVVGIIAGYLWNPYFPINKNLWTSSFVIFTAGYAMLALAACYWVVDVRRWRPALLTKPFLALGTNAILAFSLSIFIAKNLLIYKMKMAVASSVTGPAAFATGAGIGTGARVVSAWTWIYLNWFVPLFAGLSAPFNDPRNASLLFALAFVALVTLIMSGFYAKKIFVKV